MKTYNNYDDQLIALNAQLNSKKKFKEMQEFILGMGCVLAGGVTIVYGLNILSALSQ